MLYTSRGKKTVHISQCLAWSHSSWQGVMFHYVLQNEKKKEKSHASCLTSGTLSKSQLSDFKWKVQHVRQKGHGCRSHVPFQYLPPNTTMYHCVGLLLLLCFQASCSNFCPFFFFRRCESSLHNKYRKGVLVCVCEMWRVCVQVCLFFFCLTSLQNAFWVGFSFLNNPKLFERSKKNSLLHIIWFSHIFPRSFLSLWQLSPWQTHNFLLKPCDEWKMRPHGVLCKKGLRGKSSFAIERQRLSLAERTPGPFLPTAYQVQSWRGTSGCFFFFCFFCHAEVKSFTSCCYSFSSRVNKFHPVASE